MSAYVFAALTRF